MDDSTEADQVYVLLTDKYRISRNVRAEWFLQNLNKTVQLQSRQSLEEYNNEIDIISYIPVEDKRIVDVQSNSHLFYISTNTKFMFLSRKYCFVYILDMSTSIANVDIQHSNVLSEELYSSLSKCLENLVKPFYVPGSFFLYQPEIFVTILVYNPFYSNDFNNVIVHGYKLCMENIESLLSTTKDKIQYYINLLYENVKNYSHQYQLSKEGENPESKKTIIPADISLVNMIRFGLLSLNLLPENSQQGIVILTDGNISFPDANALEAALGQLRLSMISCNFMQIGSPAHPDCSLGYVPYTDFLKFIATATFGAYIAISPDFICDFPLNKFNTFHQAFLVYNFHSGFSSFSNNLRKDDFHMNIWSIENPYFYSQSDNYLDNYEMRDQQILRKKLSENKANATLGQILSYRLREGFTIKKVNFHPSESSIDLLLVLPWRHHVNIEYHITAFYPTDLNSLPDEEDQSLTCYEILVESNYSFLHDITCKKEFKSPYRATTVGQFKAALKNFTDSDQLGIHFHNFAKNEVYRSIPESVKNGVPLFFLMPNCNTPVVAYTNEVHIAKFSQYWKPICMLDINMCQKSSLHSHQINILLKHDMPLPEFLYQPNSSGRYDNIQCNQAMSALNVMLKEWSSFVLLENHSYIKLIDDANILSCSFYLIRIISQPPCIVLHLAFIGGTSGSLRNQIVNELTLKLKQCKLPQRNLSSSLMQKNPLNSDLNNDHSPESNDEPGDMALLEKELKMECASEESEDERGGTHEKRPPPINPISCFILLNRPIERMLIRYEKVPKDFNTCYKYEEDWKINGNSLASLNMFRTLTRYLYHKRFIWGTHCFPTTSLSISSVSKILSVLTMKRIQEGFSLAYNEGGIVNLVMELSMRDEAGCESPCLVQYIIFPSNVILRNRDSSLDDLEEDSMSEVGTQLLVTECWVEPKNGRVATVAGQSSDHFLQDLDYKHISMSFFSSDFELINSLLTYEYLVTQSTTSKSHGLDSGNTTLSRDTNRTATSFKEEESDSNDIENCRINFIPYDFNLLTILDKSQQAWIKFSMLNQKFELDADDGLDVFQEQQEIFDKTLLSNGYNNLINIMLYSEFLLKLNNMHDIQLVLDQEQSILFIKQANERLSNSSMESCTESNDLFTNIDSLTTDDAIVFRCFSKKISNSCVMLTIVPANYRVLRKLSFINERERLNHNLVSELNCENDRRYGSLVLPIFVHKLTFQSLSSQLLSSDDTMVQLDSNLDLLFDYSISRNKFYFDRVGSTGDNFALSNEVAIEHFCKTVETLYWNSFTDATYKSLRYAFPVDEGDIKLVLEKISSKLIFSIDITEYILYTCRHMKPLISAYFDCYPTNTIYDMLNYIMNATGESHHEELETLKLGTLEENSNCRASYDTLKINFESLILAHFSSILDVPNSFFYDYENIQAKQFSSDLIDINKKREHLVKFYNQIENNHIYLDLFYKTTKPLYKLAEGIEDLEFLDANASSESESSLSLLLTKPFFVSFSYTLTLKSGTHIVKASTIPTCILDLLTDTTQDINLENFRVQLNVEVITQNLEYPLMLSHQRKISDYNSRDSEEVSKKILDTTLEQFQTYKYYEFFERIQWTVMDEVVSISHNLFNLCPRTLRSVVEHIRNTSRSHTCFMDSIELKFIFPINKSDFFPNGLEDFRKLLKRLTYSSFALTELGDYFYVNYRQDNYISYFFGSSRNTVVHTTSDINHCELLSYFCFSEEFFDDILGTVSKVSECIVDESDHFACPNFWIIISFIENENKNNLVNLYFHSRPNYYLLGMEIFNQLRKSIEILCKKINQRFLLDRMNQTKMCDNLLITKEDQDPFNKNLRNTLNATPLSHTFLEAGNNSTIDLDFEYEEPTPKLFRSGFSSGTLGCDIVWNKHFSLHPRLLLSPTKEGYVAIKSFLASLAVQNRNNLYVYQEKSGAVFYMRIYEIDCTSHIYTCSVNFLSRLDPPIKDMAMESSGKNDIFYDSIVSATSKELFKKSKFDSLDRSYTIDNTSYLEIVDFGDFSSRIESDDDSISSLNVSRVERYNQQCILMNVHGISEPGYEIKHDLAVVLQKRLDEMVLDNLVMTIARNPHSKLAYEDVCFIQSYPSNCEDFYFVINENYFPYLKNIKVYIKQNLLTHMYNPKYYDMQEEYHFRLYKNNEFDCVEDDDVFIYYCVEESGRNSKGVAAVILSIVNKEDSQGADNTFGISHSDISDFISGNFEYITSCYSHEKESSNVKFYIHFQIWYGGKIDIDYVHQILIHTIRNSLWDFNLEFKIFKLCMLEEYKNNFNSISEPSTPKKTSEKRERRTGLSIITGFKPSLNQIEDKLYSLNQIRKMSDKYFPSEDVNRDNYFDFNNLDLNLENTCQPENLPSDFQEVKNKELLCLSHFLNVIIKPWLDFGKENRVTSLIKYQMPVIYKSSISTIVKEFTTFINSYSADMKLHFLKSYPPHFFDFELNSDGMDDTHSLMILLRHENLWNAKQLHDSDPSFTANFLRLKNENNKLYFPPCFQTTKSTHDGIHNLNISKETSSEFDQVYCIAPRQKFLLLYIEDRYLTLYLYNWSQTLSNNISTWFYNLVIWNNARSILMQSLILQRAGIFHNLPFKRYSLEDIIALSSIKSSTVKEKPITSPAIFHNAELLLKFTNHIQALQYNVSREKEKEQISNTEFIFETKNYDFVFSGLEDTSSKNLFEAFNSKFNSRQINYLKDMKELSKVWQMQGAKPPIGIVDKIIRHVKLYGRLSHYCLTPFLFSHKWRYIISVIRDHNFSQISSRLRHLSGGHVLKSGSDQEFMVNKRSRRKSGPPNMLEHSLLQKAGSLDESLDVLSVHPRYIQEYVQYLQSLGFSSIKSQKIPNARKNIEFDRKGDSKFKPGSAFGRKNSHKNDYEKFYLIKTLPGGFYMFEVGFCEPYVYSYLYAIDSKRFVSLSKNDHSHMNMTNFLDELDSIKVRMHLHSFTYDYHLRAIHSYMAGRQLFFQPGYHLISFLDDFLKYYQKAPNYARNHIYSDYIIFESQRISADQLYNYIINHHKLYGMGVFPMNSNKHNDQSFETARESVLIRLLSHPITFIDENNVEQEDNFDIGMLASYQKCNFNLIVKPKTLCLKYFVLLTSQRELYPKLFSGTDVRGEFKTVRVLQSYSNGSTITDNDNIIKTILNRPVLEEMTFFQDNTSIYNGICDEKINYLGYFNPHEMVMLSILQNQVDTIRTKLELMVQKAETDCRRDGLWKSLITIPSNSQVTHDTPLTMEEFNELLDLVKWIRADEYDPNLAQFYSFNYNWYKQLFQKLEIKFEFSHRKFQKDGTLKLAIFRTNCKDCFILFTLRNVTPPYVEIKLVFKSSRNTVIDQNFLEKCNPQYHELVEDFVNSCISHMWSALLS